MSGARTPRVPPPLHELESEVMNEAWRQEVTTVKLVAEALNRSAKPPRAYTTYMTVMRRLADKGLLNRARNGRSDTYRPRLTRDEYLNRRARAEVSGLVSEYGEVVLAHFAKTLQALDPEQMRLLAELADREK